MPRTTGSVRQLQDGLPLLKGVRSSRPYVPHEEVHARCDRVVTNLPQLPPVPENVMTAANHSWRGNGTREVCLCYSSETDIAYFIRRLLENILFASKIDLDFNSLVTIQQLQPDVYALLSERYVVGVIQVKTPGRDVLLEPTVLGELLDQMLLVEGCYGMGPVIGILATAEEWLIAWFPADSETLTHVDLTDSSFTARRDSSASDTAGPFPLLGTPSQQHGVLHTINEIKDASQEPSGDEISSQMTRQLCTTRVLNIHSEPLCVLQHLYAAFQLMSKAHLCSTPQISRCLLKFQKNISGVSFHSVSDEDKLSKVNFDQFPNKNVETLIAVEDLGRGSTGKAWMCVTVTFSACCVLKFDNEDARSCRLNRELEMWKYLYPEFADMVRVESWAGADALVMPHFSTILEHEREQYRDELVEVLTTHFVQKSKIHADVRWSNIGKYKTKSGAVALILFDLHNVVQFDEHVHNDWIDQCLKKLYPSP